MKLQDLRALFSGGEPTFESQVTKFNAMYGLPCPDKPDLYAVGGPMARLQQFHKILGQEMEEVEDIYQAIVAGEHPTDVLTMMADWYGDMIVYCASEMMRYGIPISKTLNTIMESNFSKLGADGKPIINEDGKVEKGPNYWKPEPKLKEILSKS